MLEATFFGGFNWVAEVASTMGFEFEAEGSNLNASWVDKVSLEASR